MSAIQELESQYSTGIYAKRELTVVRGEGARLWDEDGKVYIDCIGGMGVASVGHANSKVAQAIAEQAKTLITCHELLYNDRRAQLLEKLAQVTPSGLDRFFLCNSGTEAIEGAIKFARMSTGKSDIVATMRGYHGRTMGSLSATWAPKSEEHFGPLPGGFQHVAYNKLDALEETVDDNTAAIMLEIVQGEGGVRPASAEYLQGVQQLCRERDILLIVDEVQTGFGRTGMFFACEHYGLEPDIMTMAKAIAGGVPMGALAIGPRVQTIHRGTHSSTFGGNPLACAAACAVLDVMQEERLPERSAEVGAYFKEKLEAIDSKKIREVRGLGLLLGVDLKTKVGPMLRELMQRGVLVAAAGTTVLRFLPPLVITTEDVDTVVEQVADVLQ
ncbi:aspartate aminotransferase family protein [Candidatus Entotheonella serta]|nr:aspartate aminotransferase family protein [Candidatus Entotheonella serta]